MHDVKTCAAPAAYYAYARYALVATVLLAGGCGRRSPLDPCFDHVNLDMNRGGQIAVGDTARFHAGTYTLYGFLVYCDPAVVWAVSDSTVVRLEPTSRADERIARGLRVGTVTIRATIDGKTDQLPLNVVP